MKTELFEDRKRLEKQNSEDCFSPYCDLVHYESSVTPGIRLAMLVKKPKQPSYILLTTHGWHMTIEPFVPMAEPDPNMPYLFVQVDMRGRAFSEGNPDCNGLELIDVYDALQEVKERYADYILDPDIVYFEGASGGGGNAFSIAGKFPDLFASVGALCGTSDYALWYRNDLVGEFRDEMDVWIGDSPKNRAEAYASRSGITTIENILSPMCVIHGETDIRVPAEQSRLFLQEASKVGKGHLVTYTELPNVGTNVHWGNADAEQLALIEHAPEQMRLEHRKPVNLPQRGELVVAGYIYTKHFKLLLADIDRVTRIRYDLEKREISFIGDPPCAWKLEWL